MKLFMTACQRNLKRYTIVNILVDVGQYWSDDLHQAKVFDHMEVTTKEETEDDELALIKRTIIVKSMTVLK